MIGNAKFEYATRDLVQLVRKDLVDKLGNRELAPYDLAVPGVITTASKINVYPDPIVTEITVEEQLEELNLPTKPQVPRSNGSVRLDREAVGGDSLIPHFERETNTFTITGGPVRFTPAGMLGRPVSGFWVGIQVDFPLGWTAQEGHILPYTENGDPKYLVLEAKSLAQKGINLYLDATQTTHNFVFNWGEDFAPEKLNVTIIAPLEDNAVHKYPALPEKPKFEFNYPETSSYVPADIQIKVDLSLGK